MMIDAPREEETTDMTHERKLMAGTMRGRWRLLSEGCDDLCRLVRATVLDDLRVFWKKLARRLTR